MRMWILALLLFVPVSVTAQDPGSDPKDAQIAQLKALLAERDAAAKQQPKLTPAQQAALAQTSLADAIRNASSGAAAKACKAAKGKAFALVVVNGQGGWSCSIDLEKVTLEP